MTETDAPAGQPSQQRALQEELQALSDVVAPRKLIDLLLERAFENRATDIHLDPDPEGLRVRLRVDGMLHDILTLPEEMRAQVVSRLKLMANMNITERRFAQDGRISVTILESTRVLGRHGIPASRLAGNGGAHHLFPPCDVATVQGEGRGRQHQHGHDHRCPGRECRNRQQGLRARPDVHGARLRTGCHGVRSGRGSERVKCSE